MPGRHKVIAAIAWFRADQWQLLRSLSVDVDKLEQTHEEWVRFAEKCIEDLEKTGAIVRKVDVDVNELNDWCIARKRALDGAARAQFAVESLRDDDEHA
jgi:hypothetical protein